MIDAENILSIILAQGYNAPSSQDFVFYDKKNGRFTRGGKYDPISGVMRGGDPLTPQQSTEIIQAAKELDQNILFQMMLAELQHKALERIAVHSADWDAVRMPKGILYAVELIKSKVDTVKQLQVAKKDEQTPKGKKGV